MSIVSIFLWHDFSLKGALDSILWIMGGSQYTYTPKPRIGVMFDSNISTSRYWVNKWCSFALEIASLSVCRMRKLDACLTHAYVSKMFSAGSIWMGWIVDRFHPRYENLFVSRTLSVCWRHCWVRMWSACRQWCSWKLLESQGKPATKMSITFRREIGKLASRSRLFS